MSAAAIEAEATALQVIASTLADLPEDGQQRVLRYLTTLEPGALAATPARRGARRSAPEATFSETKTSARAVELAAGGLTPSAIAKQLKITHANVTGMLLRGVRDGALKRVSRGQYAAAEAP